MSTKPELPRLPLITGILLAISGVVLTTVAFVSPGSVADGFDASVEPNTQVAFRLAGRGLAMVVVLIVALYLRNAALLALVFVMRLITEIADTIAFIRFGSEMVIAGISFAILEIASLIILARYLQRDMARNPGRSRLGGSAS